jgi:hypothetical protein
MSDHRLDQHKRTDFPYAEAIVFEGSIGSTTREGPFAQKRGNQHLKPPADLVSYPMEKHSDISKTIGFWI